MSEKLKQIVQQVKLLVRALYFAIYDPRTPGLTKCLAIVVVAYALSPSDLIPDFIPILGYLDDALILPLAVYLVIKTLPKEIWQDCLIQAETTSLKMPRNWRASGLIILLWISVLACTGHYLWHWHLG